MLLEGIAESGYSGIKKQTFKITADTLDDKAVDVQERFSVTITDPTAKEENGVVKVLFTKGGAKPEITVKDSFLGIFEGFFDLF